MKVQWSLRTLLIVMTLGGPLLAGSVKVVCEIFRHVSPYEQVHPGCHVTTVTWAKAMREAEKVESLSRGFQRVDKCRLGLDEPPAQENSLQGPAAID